MERPAQTAFLIHELLRRRWSPLAFGDRPVTPEQLGSLFEAARWAPSCYNEQPWSFIVATREHPKEFERLAGCLVEANQAWARAAPVLVLAVAKRCFDRNGQENRHAWYDLGQAVALLTVQAEAMGLRVHQMAGFSAHKARELYSIPDSHEPATAFAIGYYGRHEQLPESLRPREVGPRVRKSLSEFVFSACWGQPAAL